MIKNFKSIIILSVLLIVGIGVMAGTDSTVMQPNGSSVSQPNIINTYNQNNIHIAPVTTTTIGNQVCGNNQTSIAQCPSNYVMTGGGYRLTVWWGGQAENAPDASFPYGNGWEVFTGGSLPGCMVAYAICAQKN